MLKLKDIGLTEECFTHVHNGVVTMICVVRMRQDAEFLALPIFSTPVKEKFAKWCMEHRGIEQHRLDRIDAHSLSEYPLTYCNLPKGPDLPNGAHLLVDGNHRYVKAAMLGMTEVPGRVVPENIWRRFQVGDVPIEIAEFFLAAPSGMP